MQDAPAYPPKAKTEASLQTSEADIFIYGLKKEGKVSEEVQLAPGKSCSPQGPHSLMSHSKGREVTRKLSLRRNFRDQEGKHIIFYSRNIHIHFC